jgi:membrane-associated PAP2 superfamily phosphatase
MFELTDLDLRVQDALFDAKQNAWLVDGRDVLWRVLFYSGPKIVLVGFGIGIFVAAFASARWREELGMDVFARRNLLVAGLTLATLPVLVGGLKAATNGFCPAEIQRYGGDVCYAKLFERSAVTSPPPRRGRCFPAGHASGGFALVALAGVATTRRGQIRALALAVAVGGAMGCYQMAKGAHYLSHTAVTAFLAWIVFLGWRRLLARFSSLLLQRRAVSSNAVGS